MTAIMDVPHRGAGGGARARASDCPRFRHLVRHAHSLGPRVVGEALLRLVPDRGALIRELERYDRHDARFVRHVGADDWFEPHALIRIIENTEGAGRP